MVLMPFLVSVRSFGRGAVVALPGIVVGSVFGLAVGHILRPQAMELHRLTCGLLIACFGAVGGLCSLMTLSPARRKLLCLGVLAIFWLGGSFVFLDDLALGGRAARWLARIASPVVVFETTISTNVTIQFRRAAGAYAVDAFAFRKRLSVDPRHLGEEDFHQLVHQVRAFLARAEQVGSAPEAQAETRKLLHWLLWQSELLQSRPRPDGLQSGDGATPEMAR